MRCWVERHARDMRRRRNDLFDLARIAAVVDDRCPANRARDCRGHRERSAARRAGPPRAHPIAPAIPRIRPLTSSAASCACEQSLRHHHRHRFADMDRRVRRPAPGGWRSASCAVAARDWRMARDIADACHVFGGQDGKNARAPCARPRYRPTRCAHGRAASARRPRSPCPVCRRRRQTARARAPGHRPRRGGNARDGRQASCSSHGFRGKAPGENPLIAQSTWGKVVLARGSPMRHIRGSPAVLVRERQCNRHP